jgi:mannonate dehydratase
MIDPSTRTRRSFVRASAASVTALGCGVVVPSGTAGADEPNVLRSGPPSKIRLGTRISPAWLQSENDNDLRFLKQIGVDCVDIDLIMVDGYQETGCFTKQALQQLTNRFAAVGLRIERANSLGPYYLNAHLARPEGQREIDNLKRVAELVAAAEIPVFGIQACQASQHLDSGRKGWTRKQGRGGYEYPAFDIAQSLSPPPRPRYRVTADQLWKGVLDIYRQVMPVVEGSKTRIAMHGNDPPLYEHLGSPQILCRFADFDRLFAEVPSKHNGITFCVGTRYESGENVLEGIRHFGRQGKLFHVHFRNVRGTLPKDRGYSEVFLDDGDMDMGRVVQTLHEVGYDGVIDYDHPMGVAGDRPLPKLYIAFAVGYQRGLLDRLK